MIGQRYPAPHRKLVQLSVLLHPLAGPRPGRVRQIVSHSPSVARRLTVFAVLVLTTCLSGCRHKPIRTPLPIGVLAPIDLEVAAPGQNPPEIATLPPPELGPLPSPEQPAPAPRRRPAPSQKEAEQPQQVASNDSTAVLAIGSISAGGEDITHTAQQTQDLINSVLKRISDLSSQVASARKKDIREIRNFLDKAQKALKTGDAEGANSLATRASLLMDDIEKK